MLKVKDILEIIVTIINRLEKTNFSLVNSNGYHIIDLDSSLDFAFNDEFIKLKELELYFAEIISMYSFLDQMIKLVNVFYKDDNQLIEIDKQHYDYIIQLTIRHKEIYDSFETSTFTQR